MPDNSKSTADGEGMEVWVDTPDDYVPQNDWKPVATKGAASAAADTDLWEITITVPVRLPGPDRDALFDAVVQAVEEWEPEQRDGWDAVVSAAPHRPEPPHEDERP